MNQRESELPLIRMSANVPLLWNVFPDESDRDESAWNSGEMRCHIFPERRRRLRTRAVCGFGEKQRIFLKLCNRTFHAGIAREHGGYRSSYRFEEGRCWATKSFKAGFEVFILIYRRTSSMVEEYWFDIAAPD